MDKPITIGPPVTDGTQIVDTNLRQTWLDFHRTRSLYLRDKLVEHYQHMVTKVVRYSFSYNYAKMTEDLIQEGMIGLLHAIDSFDLFRGLQFETYAYHTIKSTIEHYLRDKGNLIGRPAWIQERWTKRKNSSLAFAKKFGYEPENDQELAVFLGEPLDYFSCLDNPSLEILIEFDKSISEEDETTLLDKLVDHKSANPVDLILSEDLENNIGKLKNLHQQIITLTIFQGCTYTESAQAMKISTNYAVQLFHKAVRKLREFCGTDPNQPIIIPSALGTIKPKPKHKEEAMMRSTKNYNNPRVPGPKHHSGTSTPLDTPKVSLKALTLIGLIWPHLLVDGQGEQIHLNHQYLAQKLEVETSTLSNMLFSLKQQSVIVPNGDHSYYKGGNKVILDGHSAFSPGLNQSPVLPGRCYVLDIVPFTRDPLVVSETTEPTSPPKPPVKPEVIEVTETTDPATTQVQPAILGLIHITTLFYIWPQLTAPSKIDRAKARRVLDCSSVSLDNKISELLAAGLLKVIGRSGNSPIFAQANSQFTVQFRRYQKVVIRNLQYGQIYNMNNLPAELEKEVLSQFIGIDLATLRPSPIDTVSEVPVTNTEIPVLEPTKSAPEPVIDPNRVTISNLEQHIATANQAILANDERIASIYHQIETLWSEADALEEDSASQRLNIDYFQGAMDAL